jgi:Protein of unknown function (DUF2806)
MSNDLLKTITQTANSTWNLIASIGPLLISQSDRASEAYSRHLLRVGNAKTNVKAVDELIHREIDIYSKAKDQLVQKRVGADDFERIRINREIENIDCDIRQLGIAAGALNYLPASQELADQVSKNQETPSLEQKEISPHWLDKFNELSRVRNEDWRADLLSRALAAEASRPGTVSPRALWLLGTLEEPLFKAFSTILDLCSSINGERMLPSVFTLDEGFTQRLVPNCKLVGQVSIGNLIYMLDDTGVLAASTTRKNLPQGLCFFATYDSHRYQIDCSSVSLVVRGTILTQLGSAIASFYQPNFNLLGEEIFKTWVDSLDKDQVIVTQLEVEQKAIVD